MVEYLSGERVQGYSGTTYYHETTVNSDTGMGSGQTYYAYGSEIRSTFDGIGKKADKWTITFSNNSAEGVVEAQLYSGVEGATSKTYVASSTNDLTVTGLSGDVAEYSFTFATPRTITAGDVYVLVFKTDTDTAGSKYIKIRLVNSNDQPVQPNVENLRNYFITPANWDSGKDHTWSIDPSPYTSTYDLTSKLELVSEMNDITNVPTGTRFEDTTTRKIYRYSSDMALKASIGNTDDGINMNHNGNTGWFEHAKTGSAMIGMKISRIGLQIIKQSGATGTGVAGVWDSTDNPDSSDLVGSAKHVFASLNISTIGTAYVPDKTFGTGGDFDTNAGGEYTIQEGDYVGFCILGASGQLNIKGTYAGSVYDGDYSVLAYSNTSGNFTDQTPTDDLYLKLYGIAGWIERGVSS